MVSDLLQLTVQKREVLGKKVKTRRLAGWIPGNISMKGKPSIAIEIALNQLLKIIEKAGYTQAIELLLDKQKITVLINHISYASMHDLPEHIVFNQVKEDEVVQATVPVVLIGDAPGAQKGMIVLQLLYHLEVRALALRIPEQLEVDISNLENSGDTVRIDEIELPQALELDIDLQTPVVKLELSRSQVSQEQEVEKDEAATDQSAEKTKEDSEVEKEATAKS